MLRRLYAIYIYILSIYMMCLLYGCLYITSHYTLLYLYDTTLYCACITSFAHLLPYTTLHYTIQPQAIISAVSPYSLLQANEAWRQQFLGSVAAEQVGGYAYCLSLCVLVIFDECVSLSLWRFVCKYIFIFLLISVP